MPTCAQAASLPLSYKTNKHKATRSAETGRTRTTARLPEYFIMFSLACQERWRRAACVCVCVNAYVQIKGCIHVCWQFQHFVYVWVSVCVSVCGWERQATGLIGCQGCAHWQPVAGSCSQFIRAQWCAGENMRVTWWYRQGGQLEKYVFVCLCRANCDM